MACSVLAMAINSPTNLRWEDADRTFYWDNDPTAEYSTYTLDGVQRGFLYYKATSYSPDVLLLSPGNHTFCVYNCDAKLNCSDWTCITISVIDTIKPIEHPSPAEPYNLNWQIANATDVRLTWDADTAIHSFYVFLDDRAVSYGTTKHEYTFCNLSAGVHKLGVSSVDADGYVSDQVSVTIQFNMQLQPTVALQDAYWPFEDIALSLDGQQTVTDNANAEYAYQGTSAALLQGTRGEFPYLILPAINDVQNYDSLQLTLVARGGYWSIPGKLWARMADGHRLQVGSLPYIPLPEDIPDMIDLIYDITLPYANINNFEDYQADSLYFWRSISVPLRGAQRYIVLYGDCTYGNNYVVLDEVRISPVVSVPTSLDEAKHNEPLLGPQCIMNHASKIIRDGRLLILRGEHIYNVDGQIIK